MGKRKVIRRSNYKPSPGIVIKSKSMTIQGEATDIKMLLKRYALGEPLTGKNEPIYYEDQDHDDQDMEAFGRMDPTEQQHVLDGIQAMGERLKAQEREYKEEMKKRLKAEKAAEKGAAGEDASAK